MHLSDAESESYSDSSGSDSYSDNDSDSEMNGIIYMITNKVNGKIYIGGMIEKGTYNMKSRLQKHIYSANHPRKLKLT